MRANWKGSFFKNNFTLDKSSTVFYTFLKKKIKINDGQSFKDLVVERNMVGLKIGEFVFTRKMGVLHKKKTLNKKGKKK